MSLINNPLFLASASGALFVWMLYAYVKRHRLSNGLGSEKTTGKLIESSIDETLTKIEHMKETKYLHTIYTARYSYKVDNEQYETFGRYSSDPEETVTIFYMRTQPSKGFPKGALFDRDRMRLKLCVFLGLFFAVSLVYCFWN